MGKSMSDTAVTLTMGLVPAKRNFLSIAADDDEGIEEKGKKTEFDDENGDDTMMMMKRRFRMMTMSDRKGGRAVTMS